MDILILITLLILIVQVREVLRQQRRKIMPSIAELQTALDEVAAAETTIVNDVHLLVTAILETPEVPQSLVDQANAIKIALEAAHGEAVTAEPPPV